MDVYSVVQCFLTWFVLDTRTCQSCCTWSYGCSLRLMDVYSVVQCFLTWFGLDTRTCQSCCTWSYGCSLRLMDVYSVVTMLPYLVRFRYTYVSKLSYMKSLLLMLNTQYVVRMAKFNITLRAWLSWTRTEIATRTRMPLYEKYCRRKKEKDLKYLGECSRHPPSTPIFCVSAFANNTDMKFYHPTLT